MRRLSGFMLGFLVVLVAANLKADNQVTVESKNVVLSATGVQVGVFVSNDAPIVAMVLPLELRSVGAGCYVTTAFSFTVPVANRVGNSPLGPAGANWPGANITSKKYAATATPECSTQPGHSYSVGVAQIDFVSPDAILYATVSTGDSTIGELTTLDPGSDPAGTANASFLFTFNVTGTAGYIDIDTCCVRPANHLAYVDANTSIIAPSFTKGRVQVGNPVFPPVVSDIPDQSIDEGGAFAAIALDNFVSDIDNTDAQITWTATGQTNLIVTISPGRIATISTPNPDYNGVETITFTAHDPGNLTGSDQATFTVRPVNDPPVLAFINPQNVLAGRTLNFDASATDVDNVNIDLTMINAPAGATFSSDGTGGGSFQWKTVCADSGAHSATIIASDGLLADSQVVSITVLPNPDKFAANPDSLHFDFAAGINVPPPQSVYVSDVGCGQLAWQAAPDQPWLLVSPDTGMTPQATVATVDTAGLGVGTYLAVITISERSVEKGVTTAASIQIPVNLIVEANVCSCPCQGEPVPHCDGVFNILDIIDVVGVAFRGKREISSAFCPATLSDVNCDCVTDILDVVRAVEYIFRGGPPFCDPCALHMSCLH